MKKVMHRPGIEPGSQEWESCMLPLHQRCISLKVVLYDLKGRGNRVVAFLLLIFNKRIIKNIGI